MRTGSCVAAVGLAIGLLCGPAEATVINFATGQNGSGAIQTACDGNVSLVIPTD